jgi:purine-binding chemotaxis protein CheW
MSAPYPPRLQGPTPTTDDCGVSLDFAPGPLTAVVGQYGVAPDDGAEAPRVTDHVVVRLGSGRYAVCAPDVAEVISVPALTRIPGAPVWLCGIGNWRGHVLPVIDLRPVLGATASPSPSSARVVVLAVDDVEVGILADAVTGLLPVPDDCEPPPTNVQGPARVLLRGITDGGTAGPVGVVLTAAVIALREQLPRTRTQH